MNEIIKCKKCATEMIPIDNNEPIGMKCPKCGWSWVTTFIDPIAQDQTKYTVFLDKQEPLINAIKATAVVFTCNYLEARQGLLDGALQFSGNALTIQKSAKYLQKNNVIFHIEPEFPYSIDDRNGLPNN